MNPITDFHSHILPGMDDGSPDPEVSVKMLEMLSAQGVQRVCLTPHYLPWDETPSEFLQRRNAALEKLKAAVPDDLTWICGAEVAFAPDLSREPELNTLCLEGTNTLLLEMPFTQWSPQTVEEVIRLRLDRKLRVVLVHPERFLFSLSNENMLQKLMELNLPLQVNCETFCRWNSRKVGIRLLEMTEVPLLGTDCHNLSTRKPNMEKARKVIRHRLGQDFLDLIDHSAQQMITNEGV